VVQGKGGGLRSRVFRKSENENSNFSASGRKVRFGWGEKEPEKVTARKEVNQRGAQKVKGGQDGFGKFRSPAFMR